tara:strand:- start:2570 stop:2800 length:231 start_codon:yes stop_codon:yes gene_type:complete
MNDKQKAQRYSAIMGEYVRLEKMLRDVPQISLDEQMKQVDATHKVLYTPENLKLVNQYKIKMGELHREANKQQLIR